MGKIPAYDLQLLTPGVTAQLITSTVVSEVMYLEPQPSLESNSTEIDFRDPPGEVMNFSTKAKQSAGPWQALFERASLPKSVY